MAQAKGWVLIIEDDEVQAIFLSDALAELGFHVQAASDRALAIARLNGQVFKLILLDIRLAHDSNGEDILLTLRQGGTSYNQDTPVIVMSGYLDQELVKRLKGGVQGGLVKPFDIERLHAKLQALKLL